MLDSASNSAGLLQFQMEAGLPFSGLPRFWIDPVRNAHIVLGLPQRLPNQ